MDERLQFVARHLAGEAMSDLCREFGISRKTGYKIFDRYQECGVQGLTDRSPTLPLRQPTSLPGGKLHLEREARARELRGSQNQRTFDPQVLRHSDSRQEHRPCRARSSWPGRAPRPRASSSPGTALSIGQRPNELWGTDYRCEFLLANRQYCYPLTVTDHASRFLFT